MHERFTADDIARLPREPSGRRSILAHPECPPEVLAEADFVGSTAAMIDYVGAGAGRARVVLITECSMSDNVAVELPDVEFVRPCNLCPHMKRITLPKILHSLETMTHEVEVDPEIAARARLGRPHAGRWQEGRQMSGFGGGFEVKGSGDRRRLGAPRSWRWGAARLGLTAALGCAPLRRHGIDQYAAWASGGSSPWAQGGIAAAVGRDDAPALDAAGTPWPPARG